MWSLARLQETVEAVAVLNYEDNDGMPMSPESRPYSEISCSASVPCFNTRAHIIMSTRDSLDAKRDVRFVQHNRFAGVEDDFASALHQAASSQGHSA